MKTVYLIRHGESEGNVSDHILGGSVPLTEHGRQQAAFMAERASRLPVDAIISSTLPRARETAQFISEKLGKPVEESDLFIERRWPSSLLGKSLSDPAITPTIRRWYETFYTEGERIEDGENFADIKARGEKALKFLEAQQEKHIAVTTHGFFLRMLLGLVLFGERLTPGEFLRIVPRVHTQNTGLSVLQYYADETEGFDGYSFRGWRVRTWNDDAHLG